MICFDTQPRIEKKIKIRLEFQDLVRKIRMGTPNPAILAAAETVFQRIDGRWQPAAVLQWTEYTPGPGRDRGTITLPKGTGIPITPGHSARFLNDAGHTLVAVYTAGGRLDQLAAEASDGGDFMAAHFIDLIGLLVLEKAETFIKKQAEEMAARLDWGVSPFLSPGSVHGWDLEEQVRLASFLPLDDIGVSLTDSGVFSPFKSISCLIGIGPGYESRQVGPTCRVCSKREDCTMRHNPSPGHSS